MRGSRRADLALGAWFSPTAGELEQAKPKEQGAAGGALEPAVATSPLPTTPGLPFKARSVAWGQTQIRHGPGSSEPGCGLVQWPERTGNSNQTGPLATPQRGTAQALSGSHHGPSFRAEPKSPYLPGPVMCPLTEGKSHMGWRAVGSGSPHLRRAWRLSWGIKGSIPL